MEYANKVDQIYGLYLDATKGFTHNVEFINRIQKDSTNRNPKLTIEYLDTVPFAYGIGHPADVNMVLQHETTQGNYKKRNGDNGANVIVLGHLCIVQLYSYWEDNYRSKIAESMNVKKTELSSDIFGDIRHYRNSIIHHSGIALKEIKKCKLLKWFNEGDQIVLNKNHIQDVIFHVKNEIIGWGKP